MVISNTSILQLMVYSDDREETTAIATAMVKAYATYTRTNNSAATVEVIDAPRASLRPVRPNKPLNIIAGVLLGGLLGGLSGGLGLAVFSLRRRNAQPPGIP